LKLSQSRKASVLWLMTAKAGEAYGWLKLRQNIKASVLWLMTAKYTV